MNGINIFSKYPQVIPFALYTKVKDQILQPDRTLIKSKNPFSKRLGKWQHLSTLPNWRYEFGAAYLKGKIYIVGGLYLPTVYTVTNRVDAFDLRSKQWIKIAPFPKIIHHPSVVATEEKIYVLGGNGLRTTAYNSCFGYQPKKNSWVKMTDMPTPRGASGATLYKGLIYIAGGASFGKARNEFECFDPALNTWEKLKPMPTAREHLAVASGGGMIFALGGYTKNLSESLRVNEAYDIKAKKWVKKAPLPLPLSGFAAVGIKNSIFIFGGEQNMAVSGECHEYKIKQDKWFRRADLPVARYACAAAVAEGEVHILGGSEKLYSYIFNLDHDKFTP